MEQTPNNSKDAREENLVLCHHRLGRSAREKGKAFEEFHIAFHTELLINCGSSEQTIKFKTTLDK